MNCDCCGSDFTTYIKDIQYTAEVQIGQNIYHLCYRCARVAKFISCKQKEKILENQK